MAYVNLSNVHSRMTNIQTMKYLLLKSFFHYLSKHKNNLQLLHSFQLHWLNTAKACQTILPDRCICSSICSAHMDCFASIPEGQQKERVQLATHFVIIS